MDIGHGFTYFYLDSCPLRLGARDAQTQERTPG